MKLANTLKIFNDSSDVIMTSSFIKKKLVPSAILDLQSWISLKSIPFYLKRV